MPAPDPLDSGQLQAFLIAAGIGLLIGLERERVASAAAGVRTFCLVALLGALTGMIGDAFTSVAPFALGLVVVGAMIVAAHARRPDQGDPGTTSVAALLVCYCLGTAVWLGHATVAVMLGIATTVLLYFKTELRGIATRLEQQDWISIFQLAVLSLVILPILPDRALDPYGAVNPRQVWWMVVLISGLSLAGYAMLRLVGTRLGAAVVGIAGGLASSTATTLIYARSARKKPEAAPMAALVIVLANVVMMIRVGVLAAVVAPPILAPLSLVIAPALSLAAVILLWNWRTAAGGEPVMPVTRNPTELRTALGFGLVYAVVLFVSAWLSNIVGRQGVYLLALVSGLTDVDAITLSSLRLFQLGQLPAQATVIAIGLAVIANLAFKSAVAVIVGGRALALKIAAGLGAAALGLAAGIVWHVLPGGGL